MTSRLLPPSVRRLFRLPRRDAVHAAADVEDEIRFHLEMRAAELVARGMAAEHAMTEARRRFGDVDKLRRDSAVASRAVLRASHVRDWLAGSWQDLRFAGRQLRKAPAFTLTAVLTLALGIGANSAIFSVVHHLVLAPLPYRDGDRMVELFRSAGQGRIMFAANRELIDAWRARAHSLEALTTAKSLEFTIGRGTARERVAGGSVEPNLFGFVGQHPAVGRSFTPADTRPGSVPVVMIGYGLWQRMYGGRSDVVGRTIVVDSTPRTIVGVAPAGMAMPFDENHPRALWTPLVISAGVREVNLLAFAKLRRGVSVERARRELASIAASIPAAPAARPDSEVRVMRAQDFIGDGYRRGLVLLFGAVGVVLLIACANVANLLIVRAWNRQREFAVRAALGAGRARLARQLLAESIVLASAGGLLGLLLAWSSLHAFLAVRPAGLEELDGVRVEAAVLLWTGLLSITAAVFFGVAPAIVAGARARGEWLKAGARTTAGSAVARRMRGALVIGEIALSVMLLVAAGLLLRSFNSLERVDPGFDPRGLAAVQFGLPEGTPASQFRLTFAELLERVRAIPGVGSPVIVSDVPPRLGVSGGEMEMEGAREEQPRVRASGFDAVQPGYFQLARIRLRGRTFSGDSTGRLPGPRDEVIVNENFARRFWPGGRALGRRIRFGPSSPWMTVVGVAQNVVVPGRSGDIYDLQFYVPAFSMFPSSQILFRSRLPLDALLPAFRRAAAQTNSSLEVIGSATAETELASRLAAPRFATAVVGVFALVALVLAAVGLYGVIAYAVGQRTREIGVRVALGAQPRDVARLVVRDGASLAATGVAIGIGGAVLAGRAIRGYLYGIGSTDPLTYAAIALLLGAVGLLATYLPARRAMRVDPVVTLASE